MFDGVPEQFHQFLAPRASIPLHLSFPLHASSATSTATTSTPDTNFPPPFDPYNHPHDPSHHHHHHHHHLPLHPSLLHPLHHHSPPTHKDEEKEDNTSTVSTMNFDNINGRDQRRLPNDEFIDNSAWTNDEVLTLLRIRSSMETWFPEVTWEHVSRKLTELGFKRTADRCKEKFEEESRYFNNINYSKNYRFLSELEELYQSDHHHQSVQVEVRKEKTQLQMMEKPTSEVEGQDKNMGHIVLEEDSRNGTYLGKQYYCDVDKTEKVSSEKSIKDRKRKRQDKFEMFKSLCEKIVNQMMAQQEEMHNKLLQDMLKRDEDKLAREEAWKKREMDMMNKELEMMAQEQAIAGDRQATIIEFLKKFAAAANQNSVGSVGATQSEKGNNHTVTYTSNPTTPISSSQLHPKNPSNKKDLSSPPSSTVIPNHQNITCSAENPSTSLPPETTEVASSLSTSSTPAPPQSSSPFNSQNNPVTAISTSTYRGSSNPTHMSAEKEDVGRRWPRDEVLALINLRCSLNNNGEDNKDGSKAPLWERISQGMLELGYKRSAKRCKEKWENINKYFRKTKDNINKKRSLDSRTCPYFHQLSTLYSQGKLVSQSERLDQQNDQLNNPSPRNEGQVPRETQAAESSHQVGTNCFDVHVDGGEKINFDAGTSFGF